MIKANVARNVHYDSEADTLSDLHKFAKENPEYKILYIHTKTSSARPEQACWDNVNHWLDYIEFFNVYQWESCVDLLDSHDCVGTEWFTETEFPHYSGNFWWANADYITKLDPEFLHIRCEIHRQRSEFWIGTQNPVYYNFYSSNKNKYFDAVLPEEYIHTVIKPNKNSLGLIYRTLYPEFWQMFGSGLDEVYGKEEEPNTVLSLGLHCTNSAESLKEQHKDRKLIVYQSEPLVDSHWFKPDRLIDNVRGADEVWDYDLENLNILRSHGINAKFKPPLYARRLKKVKNLENPDIDLLFYGSYTEHRFRLICDFINGSVIPADCYDIFLKSNVVTMWNIHGKELDEFIGRSKIILNLNPYPTECRQQQPRIFYGLINNKCILSEKSRINYYGDMIVEFSDAQDLFFKFIHLMRDDNWRKYSENDFRSFSRKVLTEGENFFAEQLASVQQQ
jgi:hypothetical protein